MPTHKANLHRLLFFAFILVLPFLPPNRYAVQVINMVGIYALLGIGVNILTGYTGQISLGQAAFFGISAYTTALLNTGYRMQFLAVLPIAVLVTAAFGVFLAVPALKVKGSYLALVTIGFGEITRMVMVNWVELTRGPAGIVGIDHPVIFGFEFDSLAKYYYLILFFVVLGVLYERVLMRSRAGRALIAIREDDKAAELTGINITQFKIKSFVISAVYSAVAGVLYAMMINYVSPDSFTSNDSNIILWTVIIGGMGSSAGPVVGAAIMTILPEMLRGLGQLRMVLYGVVLLGVIMYYPGGVTHYAEEIKAQVKSKLSIRRKARKE